MLAILNNTSLKFIYKTINEEWKFQQQYENELLIRLTKADSDKHYGINNPSAYLQVSRELITWLKDVEKEIKKYESVGLEFLKEKDFYWYHRGLSLALQIYKRINILEMLYLKYCETDWLSEIEDPLL